MKTCKRCGKSLPNNARSCSNCGQRFGSAQQPKRPVSPQARPASRGDSYDRYRKKKMQYELQRKRRKRRMRALIFWLLILAVVGSVVGGMYVNRSYKPTMQSEPESTPVQTEELEATQESETPTKAPEEEPTKKPSTMETLEDKAEERGCSIYEDTSYDYKCAYPSDFVEGSLKNNNTRVTLKDEEGGAEMLINFEKIGKSDTAQSLMEEYIEQSGVDPDTDNAEENAFSVTFTRIGRIYHRKAIVTDNKYIYYDFIYDQGSDSKDKYEAYIDFIDMYLVEGNKTTAKKKQ